MPKSICGLIMTLEAVQEEIKLKRWPEAQAMLKSVLQDLVEAENGEWKLELRRLNKGGKFFSHEVRELVIAKEMGELVEVLEPSYSKSDEVCFTFDEVRNHLSKDDSVVVFFVWHRNSVEGESFKGVDGHPYVIVMSEKIKLTVSGIKSGVMPL